MSYESKTSTISIGLGDDFNVDSGVFFIHALSKLSQHEKATQSMKDDWRTVQNWLGCSGRDLNSFDDEKIGKAYRAYLALGVAPSATLQPVFAKFSSQYKRDGLKFESDIPPLEIRNVFNRLLADDKSINSQSARVEQTAKGLPNTTTKGYSLPKLISLKAKSLSQQGRAIVSLVSIWGVWTVIRTVDNYEFLGVELDRWDDDMFFANLILPPLLIWIAYRVIKWVRSSS